MLEFTKDNFETEVLKSDKPVMVDFWATWCMPCKMIAPLVEEVAREYQDKCKSGKLNIDEAMEIATQFGVMNIPTIIFFKNGQPYERLVGAVSKENLVAKLQEVLA